MADRTFFMVESGKLITYIRHGECKECGECCRCLITGKVPTLGFSCKADDSIETNDQTDWTEYEGYSITSAQGLWWYWPPLSIKREERRDCKMLRDGKICEDWQSEDWPALCRYFPLRPEDIAAFPECGFSFERME